ncbi:IucA/IucC family protein [Streptomyces sp. AV19]|uniref:IucA/IucC family protein n=1 Tax=Streptomyces sp. AV19 TaxID=2793068 RepID=UPI001F341350|nr:IucA/IucC family protein [Streptomyces sp. AV19]MDG4535383.1 iron transporter [Streptomyces sp. AV19]
MKAPLTTAATAAARAVVPRGRVPADRPGGDPLDHPDPRAAADSAARDNLLRCWVHEQDVPRPRGNCLQLPLPACGTVLHVPVRYWSATGAHRFGAPTLTGAPGDAPVLDAVTLAALLGHQAAHAVSRAGRPAGAASAALVVRVADSVRRTASFLGHRRARPEDPDGAALFLHGEQSSLLGHPLHPAPKSREGLSAAEAPHCSPETRGGFPLHWLAVHRSVLVTDSAWTERGRPVEAAALTARLLPPGVRLPDGTVPLPLHPWQARTVRHHPAVARLLDDGLLHDLGPRGEVWHPTSSVRTVHRPGAPAMLRLSLDLDVAGSGREPVRAGARRGVELHRLLRSGLAERWRAACPGFDVVRDPAWLAADAPDGTPVPGLDAVVRHNPFGPGDDAVCLAGLTALRPWPGRGTPAGHPAVASRLADVVARLALRTGRPEPVVAAEWFLRYLSAVVRPVLWLDGAAGVVLDAHQQNTLVLLDPDGWPAGGRYRGGHRFREARRAELEARLPGIGGESEAFVPDASADERLAHHLGRDNVLGLVGALGAQRLLDERVALAAFRRFLARSDTASSTLPGFLLEAPALRSPALLADGPGHVMAANPLAVPGG